MKLNLGWKLGLTYLGLIVIAMMALGSFILDDFQTNYINSSRDNLLRYGNVIANKSAPFLRPDSDRSYLDFIVRDYSQQMNNRVLIVDHNQRVVADSAKEMLGRELKGNEVAQALLGRTAYQVYQLNQYGMVLYLAVPVASGKENLGAVMIAADINHLAHQLDSLRERLIFFSATTGLAIFALSLLLAKLITRPLGALHQGVQALERGKYGTQIDSAGTGEFATLARAFNQMSTNIDQQDQIRKQFVANASHELKTPLASMKALVEATLREGGNKEEALDVLADVNQEVDRLNKLVGDLLLLSSIENNQKELKLQEISLGELASQVVKSLEPLAKQKAIHLDLTDAPNIYWNMDGEMIFRALYNMVDNAIKYAEPESVVLVGYKIVGQKLQIWVKDNGAGIAPEEVEKIFQRFYRVDKARSRDTGGAGLGLAIAAEIVNLHKGYIDIDSQVGQGSTFTINMES